MDIIFIIKLTWFLYMPLEPSSEISVVVPTIQQEATSVWRTINDIAFFQRLGYKVNLPQDELIDSLILKSKRGDFGNDDYPAIYQLLESKVYNADDYKLAAEKVNEQKALISSMLQELEKSKDSWEWEFKTFENYEVLFTLYGSGGSYDPQTGTITLFTTPEGAFKNYKNPANTIIHEIVHIGVEQSIIQTYKLQHVDKEKLVDKLVYLLFGDLLPNYKIQNFREAKIDHYLKDKNDIKELGSILNQYTSDQNK